MSRSGIKYEDSACAYLQKNGYEILERGFRTPMGEIDIIARKNGNICFIEVKGRGNAPLCPPLEAVTLSKRKKIVKTAKAYLKKTASRLQPRFDVVAFEGDSPPVHIEGAFDSGGNTL